jgi:hypothetical protein
MVAVGAAAWIVSSRSPYAVVVTDGASRFVDVALVALAATSTGFVGSTPT